jgi:4-hydroxy-2-oxoheptanedioate aldolase
MKNKLKQILASGRPAIGTWISMTDPYGVEMVAALGFDWLLIDMEHVPMSKETLRGILMACKGS